MSNTAVVTLADIAPGQTFTVAINTQSGCTYSVKVLDQANQVLVDKTAGGVNWNFTTAVATAPTDASRWPLSLQITGNGGSTLSVLDQVTKLAGYNATYITSYVVCLDDAGTGSDRDFQDLVVTLNAYRTVG
ncbi:hypothetical protein [Azospirillum rugosum]|uniref:Uncharacterized protein n=1 Tax=Azospirillum rugosum TaxID=416170 RepID=A0ABS4SD96_9PROT|nr:hypothetical protein [Azospirillum rugosum]MBP2290550.1 hypothetical protein [Azospirillum rugosum]MDQ0525438.1 hypothetical protein [Azospirillum rugosum]